MANNIISRLRVSLGLDNSKFKSGLKDSEKQTKGFGQVMKKAGQAFAGYFAFTQIIAGIKSVIKTNKDFEKSLSTLQSLTGVTNKELKFYSSEAKRMGETTTQTASQVADAFTLIGSKKPELLESKEALAAVTEQAIILAEAANIDVVQAATAISNSLNQMGKGADSASEFINILAAGSKFGAGNITFLNAAIEKAGASADATGLDFGGLVAAIETIAPKIAEPTTAGLQLRQVLIKLQKETNNFNPAVVGLGQALKNLGKEQLTINELTQKFGILNVNAAKALIDGADDFERYRKKVSGTNTALEQQAINVDNLDGDTRQFNSALEGLILKLQSANGAFRGATQAGTAFLRMLSGADVGVAGTERAVGAFESIENDIKSSSKDAERVLRIALEDLENEYSKSIEKLKRLSESDFVGQGLLFAAGDILTGGRVISNRLKEAQVEVDTNLKIREKLNARIRELTKKRLDEEEARIKGTTDSIEEAAVVEIRTIKSIGLEIEALKQTKQTATGDHLINTNKRISALSNELSALKRIGLEIDKNATKSGISGKQTGLGTKEVSQAVGLPSLELPTTLSTDGTLGDSKQLEAILIGDKVAADQEIVRNQLMQTQNAMNAYGSVVGSVGQITAAMGDSTIATFAGVAAQVISSVAQMIPALFAQSVGGAVASGSSLPFPYNLAAIAAGVAGVVSAFSGIGGGSASVSSPVTSIDTRGFQSPTTDSATRRTAATQTQDINVNVTGTIKGKDIALANNQGQKQLQR